MTLDTVLAIIAPTVLLGGLLWRLSARLTMMDAKLDRLEQENRQLRSDLIALQTLLRVVIDPARMP